MKSDNEQETVQINGVSKADIKKGLAKAMSFADAFIGKAFAVGKLISVVCMFICLLVMACSLLSWMSNTTSGVRAPDFDDYSEAFSGPGDFTKPWIRNKKDAPRGKDEFQRYEKDIRKILSISNLEWDDDNLVMRQLAEIDEKYRDDYVDGLLDFVKDAEKKIMKSYGKFNGEGAIRAYHMYFDMELKKSTLANDTAKVKSALALSTFSIASILLLVFLVVPLLIQIEKNTRR